MARMSVATIDSPEFINLQPLDINPLMSSCEIKVLYVGRNRNNSYITKEVATEMSKTLRGAPIVGWYREEKEDFGDHGERVIIDADGVKFNCLTKPYGFVAPDAKVWFQKFEDTDEFGNTITREYLMTTGYLWTGQFEEAKKAVEGDGRPHSMELDDESLDGHWSNDVKSGMDFFIINDAIFSKLCILGNDVEPCFEGSSVTAPDVSKKFTKIDNEFKNTLFTMMHQLQDALQGGQQMEDNQTTVSTESVTENVEPAAAADFTEQVTEPVVDTSVDNQTNADTSFVAKNDSDKEDNKEEEKDTSKEENDDEDKEEEKDEKYSLLEQKFSELESKYSALEADYKELVEFRQAVEDEKKDDLIKSFYMLSDEDKKEVIENKSKFSLDEIEAKLSVICVRKKVNFDLEDNTKNDNKVEETPAVTFNLDNNVGENVPAWISAVKRTHDMNSNS